MFKKLGLHVRAVGERGLEDFKQDRDTCRSGSRKTPSVSKQCEEQIRWLEAGGAERKGGRPWRQEEQHGGCCLGSDEWLWEPKPGGASESDRGWGSGDRAQKRSASRDRRPWRWSHIEQTADGGAEDDIIPPGSSKLLGVSQDTFMCISV